MTERPATGRATNSAAVVLSWFPLRPSLNVLTYAGAKSIIALPAFMLNSTLGQSTLHYDLRGGSIGLVCHADVQGGREATPMLRSRFSAALTLLVGVVPVVIFSLTRPRSFLAVSDCDACYQPAISRAYSLPSGSRKQQQLL
jgi:hypothetical protein